MKPRRFKIVLEYDGTDFAGWQIQPNGRTVQWEVERALKTVTGEDLKVRAAGRTDSGVHARGQVADFASVAGLDTGEWVRALNAHLPDDVKVLEAAETSMDFDARRNARGKLYRYEMSTRKVAPVIDRRCLWHVKYRLDIEAMMEAARFLVGEHDFTSFKGSGCASRGPVRKVRRLDLIPAPGERISVEIEATAFLKHMVRNIVGTLVEVGRGRIGPKRMKEILEARDRGAAGPTAPPGGLTLMQVYYRNTS